MTFANSDVYEGMWKLGNMHGKGKFQYKSGNLYIGDYSEGNKTGKGIFTFASSGNKYDGDWINSKMSGEGIMYISNGDIFNGIFFDDKMVNGNYYIKELNKTYQVEFKGGNKIQNNKRVYDVIMKYDNKFYKECLWSNGIFF